MSNNWNPRPAIFTWEFPIAWIAPSRVPSFLADIFVRPGGWPHSSSNAAFARPTGRSCHTKRICPNTELGDDHLRKIPGRAAVEVVPQEHTEGREAVLHYHVAFRSADFMLLELVLETGRTHQIRVQAASRGLPILGDKQYGSQIEFGPTCQDPREQAIALHACRLEFEHPMTRATVAIEAPLPPYWPAQMKRP